MHFIALFLLAIGLSMDAFAVSICKGVCLKKITLKKALIPGIWFGVFQALMPLIGYTIGIQFESLITSFDHWIAFALLVLIGGNMIREALEPEKDDELPNEDLSFRSMLLLAIATSIDALAIGITFAFLSISIIPAISLIGTTTLILSTIGVKIGSLFGFKYKNKAELLGGVILILLGIKILCEHLFG